MRGGTPVANHLQKRKTGFTIIELLIALCISSILIAAAYRTFASQHKVYNVQNQVMEMQQGVRVTMDILVRDIRMAGFNSTVALSNPIAINPVEEGIRDGTDSIAVQYQYNGVERTITYFVDDENGTDGEGYQELNDGKSCFPLLEVICHGGPSSY